ncbi:MAG: glycoside hydrolase family 25 protein [Saprospiraceae bacterium]|nr:glycoside hydrolase family 25 protein [Saprospiraceae bacterium]
MAKLFQKLLPFGSSRGQRPPAPWWVGFLLIFALGMMLSPWLRFQVLSLIEYPLHYKEYKHFGIRIPNGYAVHGIDVSRYQRRVDWERVSKMKVEDVRISFAFIKATEGSWMKDPEFERNWENARDNKIVRGAYHFFLPDVSPRDQAQNFIKAVRLQSGDLPPVVDVEERRGMSREQVRRATLAFIAILEKKYGVKPILYTNRDFYKNHFANQPEFKPYCFWIAHYHVSDLDMPDDSKWHFWQHSDRGRVNGINEPVDFNVFYGDFATLQRLCVP